ncbi:F-box protein At5g07610-like [Rutidosis leptorrhynchoides]|uniref:F-box protein At5g07610-like n=1 Tax=Rutidosis leptorrhynchoides TaxID=125765 RepID=UPI003A98D2A5
MSPVVRGLFYDDFYFPFDFKNRSNNLRPFRSPHGSRIVQSCNGLLLCCSETGSEQQRTCIYYVFNPTTNQYETIPSVKQSLVANHNNNPFTGLAVHHPACPTVKKSLVAVHNSNPFMGLAVDPSDCKRYKVVCIYRNLDLMRLHILIYSSETKRWKISDETLDMPKNMPDLTGGVYMNGGIYWSPIDNHVDSWYCFKLDVEKFQKLGLPSDMKTGRYRKLYGGNVSSAYYFGESNGRLYLVDECRVERFKLNVYEKMNDGSGWVVKYQVELRQFMTEFHGYDGNDRLKILDIVRGEEEKDTFMVVKFNEVIKSFKLFNKKFKKLFIVPRYNNDRRIIRSYRYVV